MSALAPGQAKFATVLSRETGLNPRVVGSWLLAEQNGSAAQYYQEKNYNNWLNIARTDTGDAGGAHSSVWSNPETAAKATAEWLRGQGPIAREYGKPAGGIERILNTTKGDPEQQIAAIANSGWASSGYNGGSTLRSLYKEINPNELAASRLAPIAPTTELPGVPTASPSVAKPVVPKEVESLDKPAFEKAQKASLVGKLLASEKGSGENPLLLSGLATTKAPLASEYQTSKVVPGTPEAKKTPVEPANGVHLGKALPKGLSQFGDKKVAAWIDPILKYAQQHGWKGSVQSGYRSKAEQERIYDSGVRPAAVPGTSNHEGDEFPRGAVDVSEAQQLSEIIKRSPYAGTLVWAGSKDPVHFSHPHNGSY